jgi:glycerophosphoryl diester phosphodiesterase
MRRLWAIAALIVPMTAPAFDLQGHRGARGLAPENTLQAFAAALAVGVTTLELDTGVTKDGVVVIHHDRRLNPDIARGPDGRWVEAPAPLLHELNFAELRGYDVGRLRPGSKTAEQFPEQEPADGARRARRAVRPGGKPAMPACASISKPSSPQAEALAPDPRAR